MNRNRSKLCRNEMWLGKALCTLNNCQGLCAEMVSNSIRVRSHGIFPRHRFHRFFYEFSMSSLSQDL